MPIDARILGGPAEDNAALVRVDTGSHVSLLLFDCGEGVLSEERPGDIQSIEALFFSHYHMDHVAGFDSFFRHNYNRDDTAVHVLGPAGTMDLMAHRFQGFTWNLHHDQPGVWNVTELDFSQGRADQRVFLAREAFASPSPVSRSELDRQSYRGQKITVVYETEHLRVDAVALPHGNISSMGYRVTTPATVSVNRHVVDSLGIPPGPWLQDLKSDSTENVIQTPNGERDRSELRSAILTENEGESLVYLTDFGIEPDDSEWDRIVQWLAEPDHLICECQYRHAESGNAKQHGHMTAENVGKLAAQSKARRLTLHHVSRRYDAEEQAELLAEAQASFPNARWGWDAAEK